MRAADPRVEEPEGALAGRRRWRAVSTVVSLVLAFATLLAWGLRRDPRALPSVLEGGAAPDFTLRDMDAGRTIELRDLRGQVVVLNFWASWCTACREEHPNFLAAWTRYRDRGVVFVGVVYQDSPENARAYMRELGGDWPSLIDPGSETAIDYGVYGVPETFFIGRDGSIAAKQVGGSSYDLLVGWIERLLRPPSGDVGGEP